MEPLAQEKNIKLIGKYKNITMIGSDILIYRLVYNLVENAIKYNRPGGQVVVTAEWKEKHVFLSVEDTGSGIPEELRKRVFEPFFRVDKSRSRELGGVGLGLALVYEIVIFEDMLEFINEKIESIQQQDHNDVNATLISKKVIMLDKIKNVVRNIVRTYGNLFNGYTSIENIQDEQIVTFDISALKDMKAEVFDAQIFNMISLCWDNCVTNGKLMMKGLKEETVKVDDVVHTLILIDESHRWVNTKKQQALTSVSMA